MSALKRNRTIKVLCLMVAMIVAAMALCACGEKEALSLEDMISENPQMAKDIEKNLGTIATEGVSPSLSYEGNTVLISLKYDKTYKDDDVEILTKAFEENGDVFDAGCEEAVENIKASTELSDITIKILVLNGDDTELWTKSYGGK